MPYFLLLYNKKGENVLHCYSISQSINIVIVTCYFKICKLKNAILK